MATRTSTNSAQRKAGKKTAQLSLFPGTASSRCFGGSLLKGNAKTKRPLSTKSAVHLVLKSAYATGSRSMLQRQNSQRIDRILRHQAKTAGVRIYHLVNAGNHLHLVVRIQSARLFARFLRSITGLIARHVMRRERGAARVSETPTRAGAGFWVARPFTRLVTWGRDYRNVSAYMDKNRQQVARPVAWGFDILDSAAIRFLNTG